MMVALLANKAWLDEELAAFQHLVVGLIDEQVRVAQVVPEDLPMDDANIFGERLSWKETRVPWLNRFRLSRLAGAFERLGLDLIHALDGRLWSGAAALAQQTDAAAIFSACSYLDLSLVEPIARAMNPARVAFTAATEPIGRAIRQKLDPSYVVETILPGVHPQTRAPSRRAPSDPLCAIISGDGRYDAHFEVILQGIARVTAMHPQTQFFLDGQNSDQHQLWKAASRLDLLSNLSLVPRRLGHRELLLRADVLLHPQPGGRSRGITLQAMAHGIPIVAHHDPWLDYLVDGQTAWVVEHPTAEHWTDYLNRLIRDPDAAAELGRSAQAWVERRHLAAGQLNRVLDIYRRITAAPIEFPG